MPKVHAEGPSTTGVWLSRPVRNVNLRATRFSKLSLLYSCFYVANIVLEPLKAYVGEPVPWSLRHVVLNTSTLLFEDFVNNTFHVLRAKYNNRTLAIGTLFSRDRDTNTALIRSRMTLPSNSPTMCDAFVIHFPGSIFYGQGMVQFVCNFLAQNTSDQSHAPQFICQHNRVAGLLISESCTWIEALPNSTGTFWVYHAVQIMENATWSWIKLGLRLGLSCFIAVQVWRLYYCQYRSLVLNLRTMGLSSNDGGLYEIQIGDPTWLILSHPFVCIVMVVDVVYSTSYAAIAGYRVYQVHDMWEFAIGSFSGSNMVWASYAIMIFSSPIIKRLQWEKYFVSVDPGMMALMAAFYAGPLVYFITQTPIVLLLQELSQIGVLADDEGQTLDGTGGMVFLLIIFATVPLITSYLQHCRLRNYFTYGAPDSLPHRSDTRAFASMRYNDWKHRGLYPLHKHLTVKSESGGTLYHLFDVNPRFKKLPLFSCRGTDCFVKCIDSVTGRITHQYRLSLILALDIPIVSSQSENMSTIPTQSRCTTGAVCTFVKPINREMSADMKAVLIPAASNCQWLL
ncbi:Aste57867_19744 [Aphanomyces stellatus]|uniref:Aste57867_19744 protein n=1 Tax=Aphanomyces stellatus TaxID=120398 RepID=A0A485LES6_9STRA|nr:hypothetical protein As57867_019679 [Aphanomyces stellatus]VFT96442.1 Aste57867_19744 [Aphanomyces stellatus]